MGHPQVVKQRSTLLSDPALRRRPCASLALHLHQVEQGTFTPKLSNMFGTHGKGHAAFATWPLFMPATTYSPTHFRVQYHRPCGA
jgi:hypothetical protein